MRSTFIISALTIVLSVSGSIVPAVAEPIATPRPTPIMQQQISEIDRAIEEGERLLNVRSAESFRKAIAPFEKALGLARSAQSQDRQAFSLSTLGRIYNSLGDKEKALTFYNQSLSLWRTLEDQASEVKTLNNIAVIYSDLGEKQKALALLSLQALPLSRTLDDRSGTATTLNNMGTLYSDLGEKQKALAVLIQALPLRRLLEDRPGEATTLNNLAGVYSDLGEKRKALDAYTQSLSLSRKLNDLKGEARTINNMGEVYSDLGEKQKALDLYTESLPLWRAIEDQLGEATTLSNMGGVYSDLGEKQKALEFYTQSLSVSDSLEDRAGKARRLNNIGAIYADLGEKQKALDFYTKSLLLSRNLRDPKGEATTLNNIGRVYADAGEKQKALDLYTESLPFWRALNDQSGEATTLNNIGGVYAEVGEEQKALDFYTQSLVLWRTVENRSGEALTLNNIASVLNAQKQFELAIAIYKRSVNVYESIRTDNEKLPKELQASYVKIIASTYQDLANLLIKQARIPEAQAVLELLKLKEINTYTRDAQLPSKGISFTADEQKALDEFLNIYGTAANFARQISHCAETKCPKLEQLQKQRDEVNRPMRNMLDRLRTTLKDQVIDISKLNTSEFNNAAKAIVNAQPGTILIYPVITEDKIQFLIALKASAKDETQVIFRAIEGPTIKSEELFEVTNTFRNALSNRDSDIPTLEATGKQLYDWLIKPLESEINHPSISHLVFVLDRATRNIPIAALHDGKQYLINRRQTITAVTSAIGTNPSAPPPKTPSILALGASKFQTAPALSYVESEMNAIVKTAQTPKGIFPGDRYLNTQFTFNTLKTNLKLKKHNILHIATHGIFDAGNIDNSHLLTSQGEKITKREISDLQDNGLDKIHLVILSACNTGTGGKNSDNLEIAGISHYFMTNGAKSIIPSLWQVDDLATALFMQQFYQHIQSGKTKAKALQQVQQDFISGRLTLKDASAIAPQSTAFLNPVAVQPNSDIRTDMTSNVPPASLIHPFYWSPFILIGNNL